MYMYSQAYACLFVCTCARPHTCMHVCLYARAYARTYVNVCLHILDRVQTYIHTYVRICTCIRAHVYVHRMRHGCSAWGFQHCRSCLTIFIRRLQLFPLSTSAFWLRGKKAGGGHGGCWSNHAFFKYMHTRTASSTPARV